MDKLKSSGSKIKKLIADNTERLKELACINETTAIIKQGKAIDETLQQIVLSIPKAWQYPKHTVARIRFDSQEYKTGNFKETSWVLTQMFETIDKKKGIIQIFYLKKFPKSDEGPFLKEERDLIDNLSNIILGFINSIKAKAFLKQEEKEIDKDELIKKVGKQSNLTSRQLLQRFLNKHNSERNLFHDLMPFKVKEILLVANLYDAYSIEKEGRFSEHMLGEYHQLNLTSLPRVTGVSSEEEAIIELKTKHYDLVIIMIGVDKKTPIALSKQIKEKFHYVPIYLLLNNNNDIALFEKNEKLLSPIDEIFVWNGDSKVFFAMVKLLEDRVNVENDTKLGLTRVILLVEDSAKYYSRYLPMLYSIILEQTKHLIEDVNSDDLYKVYKLRARPKILLASNYEDAVRIYKKYKNYLLCLISDVRFPRNGKLDDNAGFELIKFVRKGIENLPSVLQSSDIENATKAHDLKSNFINKNSESLLQDLKSFITFYLGFGHFVYRDNEGRQIAVAKSMREFESQLEIIPEDSLLYHALKNHFSLWLMARGEIQLAKIINPLKITDFNTPGELREFLINIINTHRNEKDKGKIVNFEESAILQESNVVSFASGSLGGKGRGVAFINTLIYNLKFSDLIPSINIRTPRTSIIGTDEFDIFLEKNNLHEKIYTEKDYDKIKKWFLKAELSYSLVKKLKLFLKLIRKPIAIRSSSLFEDSLMQPFSGIYKTQLLPNSHSSIDVRVTQAMDAIKLVYASIYSKNARTYFEAINYKIEEEKMAIVIQEVVGNQYDNYFYPHISGTAQSHNYYPIAHMKPDEGFAVAAVGLGQYVVEGEKAFRFSPTYPKLDITTSKDLYKNSQLQLYVVDLNKKNLNLLEGEEAGLAKIDISEAEKHESLKHCASVYDNVNDRITPGLDLYGPRIINFANILKYEYIPLAQSIKLILDVVKEALGSPVEIEFAVDLNKTKNNLPSFYLLQIKPLVGIEEAQSIDITKINKKNILLYSEKSLGNGIIKDIYDVIFIDPDKFRNSKTLDMTYEIEKLNSKMLKQNKKYILIGPGRWGTRDKYIGIPVAWPQISNAKVIVEMSMEDFPLDASLGSHFFHNVTSMKVGYFSVNHTSLADYIKWEILKKQKIIEQTEYFKHVEFEQPLSVIMDGKRGISLITRNNVINK